MNPNDIIGRYRLVRYIGSGSFGEVWEAEDVNVGVSVALKFYVALDETGQNEFETEYKNTYGLSHSHLLTVKTYDFYKNRPYLVMDLCPNGSVERLCGKMSDEREVWRFIRDVASGLAYLHGKDIVHQDIKPANIMINTSGEYMITDFGISRNLRATMRKQSRKKINESSGALAYMAPERFSSDPIPVKASDVWSLGASVFELITGELPFGQFGGSMQHAGASLSELPSNISMPLKKVISRCLHKETWSRYTAEQLETIAQNALDGKLPLDGDEQKKDEKNNLMFFNHIGKHKKTVIIAASSLIVVVFSVITILRYPDKKRNEQIMDQYVQLINDCSLTIDSSESSDNKDKFVYLLRAKCKMDSIERFEAQNADIIGSEELGSVVLFTSSSVDCSSSSVDCIIILFTSPYSSCIIVKFIGTTILYS